MVEGKLHASETMDGCHVSALALIESQITSQNFCPYAWYTTQLNAACTSLSQRRKNGSEHTVPPLYSLPSYLTTVTPHFTQEVQRPCENAGDVGKLQVTCSRHLLQPAAATSHIPERSVVCLDGVAGTRYTSS